MAKQDLKRSSPRAAGTSTGRAVWLAFCAVLGFYSLLVWDAGYRQSPIHTNPMEVQQLDRVEAKSNLGVPYREVASDALAAYPLWNNLTAMVTGTRFGFGTNGNTEPLRFYASMTSNQKSVLSVHMALGGLVLLLGLFQFTPSFRKTHRKAHRAIGLVYILSNFTLAFAAIFHMLHAGVENTYQGFAFHIQLWFLVISTLIAQMLAIFFLMRRNFALHLGFQVYTFVAFLNAPIQRLDWAVFGALYPHLTQGEVNNLVNILTFWQCLLIGYALFAWNRAACPVRRDLPPIVSQPLALKIMCALGALAAALTSVALYVGTVGLDGWRAAKAIVPASTLAAEATVLSGQPLQAAAFGMVIAVAILSGVWLMIRNAAARGVRWLFYVSAIAAGVQQIIWGFQLGEPSMAVTSGGGFYLVSGASLAGFALLALFFQRRGQDSLWHEAMVFAVHFAVAPALLLWGITLWHWLDVIPAFYIARGHGYVLAAGAAILIPTFTWFLLMMTSRETRSRIIS